MRKSFIVIPLFAFFSSPAWAISGYYRQAVRGKIQHQLPAVRTCYDNASEPKPKREATVVVRFDINANGQVETAEIAHSDLKNTEVEDCSLATNEAHEVSGTTCGRAGVDQLPILI